MRTQLELSNEVATELAGAQDTIMRTLEDHLDCEVYLRGNMVTLDGGKGEVATAETSAGRSTATRARAASSRT